MASHDDAEPYIMIPSFPFTSAPAPPLTSNSDPNVYSSFTAHCEAPRVSTETVISTNIKKAHPDKYITQTNAINCDLFAFAGAGKATATPIGPVSEMITERAFAPPVRRQDSENGGAFVDQIKFAIFDYAFEDESFLVYIVDCRDGTASYPQLKLNFVVSDKKNGADQLIKAATNWNLVLHEEVLIFDMGFWRKDKDLFKAISDSNWEDVIMDHDKKQEIIDDVGSFFDGEKTYKEFSVPWKRGLIFWGPPGNGKTISIKALMNGLRKRTSPTVELLYVKTLNGGFGGPEYAIRQIFTRARAAAPCMLIFEDLDSLVTPFVRSYFLNEVDGLESNHGILMVGSTNHLERLDPGISKRPSRFDRKYLFSLPNRDERVLYCQYWRKKLSGNKKIDFPEVLCDMIADITEEFSFAYLKEAFVASLLAIAAKKEDHVVPNASSARYPGGDGDDGRDKAEKSILWKEIQKQVKNLRDELNHTGVKQEEVKKTLIRDVPERGYGSGRLQKGGGPSWDAGVRER